MQSMCMRVHKRESIERMHTVHQMYAESNVTSCLKCVKMCDQLMSITFLLPRGKCMAVPGTQIGQLPSKKSRYTFRCTVCMLSILPFFYYGPLV